MTGAPADPDSPIDLFVECPDPLSARLAARLAMSWVMPLLRGRSVSQPGQASLELVAHLYRASPGAVVPREIARIIEEDVEVVRNGLRWLEERGIACRADLTMNFSGSRHYRICLGHNTDNHQIDEIGGDHNGDGHHRTR